MLKILDNIYMGVANSGSGGGGGSGEFQLTRVKDDSNNEIGTHICNFTDGNGNKYKVVCLDAQYRLNYSKWCTSTATITNMTSYGDLVLSNIWDAKETATQNTQSILDYCSANNQTSTACSHCRSNSFVINGVTYYGQLPNAPELFEIIKNYNTIQAMDTSASSYSTKNFSSARAIWSSNQYNSTYAWYINIDGTFSANGKTSSVFACPVLEIPA